MVSLAEESCGRYESIQSPTVGGKRARVHVPRNMGLRFEPKREKWPSLRLGAGCFREFVFSVCERGTTCHACIRRLGSVRYGISQYNNRQGCLLVIFPATVVGAGPDSGALGDGFLLKRVQLSLPPHKPGELLHMWSCFARAAHPHRKCIHEMSVAGGQ